jgi:hypothetical protein
MRGKLGLEDLNLAGNFPRIHRGHGCEANPKPRNPSDELAQE